MSRPLPLTAFGQPNANTAQLGRNITTTTRLQTVSGAQKTGFLYNAGRPLRWAANNPWKTTGIVGAGGLLAWLGLDSSAGDKLGNVAGNVGSGVATPIARLIEGFSQPFLPLSSSVLSSFFVLCCICMVFMMMQQQ